MSVNVCVEQRNFNLKKAKEAEQSGDFFRASAFYYAAALNEGTLSQCSPGMPESQRAASIASSVELAKKSREMKEMYERTVASFAPPLRGKGPDLRDKPCPPSASSSASQEGGGGGCPNKFDQTPEQDITPWTWDQIIGMDSEKQTLQSSIVLPIRQPQFYKQLGLKPTDVLLYGPGGTGKTTLIKVVANYTGLPMFEASAADIKGGLVGQSEKCFKEFISAARSTGDKGGIAFLDEADGILAPSPGEPGNLLPVFKNIVQEQRLMPPNKDSFLLVAATNNPAGIGKDDALMSRFALRLFVGLPDRGTRRRLIEFFASKAKNCSVDPSTGKQIGIKVNLTDDEWKQLLDKTVLYSPRELKQLVNQALLYGVGGIGLINLTELSFCPSKKIQGAWEPVLNSQDASCKRYDQFQPDELDKLRICWPDLVLDTFLKVLKAGIVKRATTRTSMLQFKSYADKVQDEVGKASIDASLSELTSVLGDKAE
jgi:ATPase family protein associated with various cellular activities (AAA)